MHLSLTCGQNTLRGVALEGLERPQARRNKDVYKNFRSEFYIILLQDSITFNGSGVLYIFPNGNRQTNTPRPQGTSRMSPAVMPASLGRRAGDLTRKMLLVWGPVVSDS